jgi:hypothetical protein
MAISLGLKRTESLEEGLGQLAIVSEFRRRFEAEMETIACRELTGFDMTTAEGVEAYMKSDKPQTVCFPAVGIAYRLAVDVLKEHA